MSTEEVKKAVNEMASAFEQFKQYNEEALSQKADREHVDSLVQEAQSKANEHIDQISAKLDEKAGEITSLRAAVQRGIGQPGSDMGLDPEAKARKFEGITGQEEGSLSADAVEEYRKAFSGYLRRGEAMPSEVAKAMQVGRDPEGGFWVEPETDGRIVTKIYETSAVRQVANVTTIGSDALEGPLDLDEPETGWVGETEDRPDTRSPQVGKWRIPVHEQYAQPRISQKMLDDAMVDVEGWLEDKVARKLARSENHAFVKGDGSNKPRGFLSYSLGDPDSENWERIPVTYTGSDGAFPSSDPGDVLIDAIYGLKEEYRTNATWAMNRSVEAEVRKLKDGQGNYLWQPDFSVRNGRTILGANIINFEDMPGIATNSMSIAVADWEEAYQIVDRAGIRVLRDPYTGKPFVKFYTTKRVGGGVVNFEAIKLIKFGSE